MCLHRLARGASFLAAVTLLTGAAGCTQPRELPLLRDGATDEAGADPVDADSEDAGGGRPDGATVTTSLDGAPADGPTADAPADAAADAAGVEAAGPDLPVDGPAVPLDVAPAPDIAPADSALARKATGQGCNLGGDCESGVCVDQICCAGACDGLCRSCAEVHTGQPNGTCAAVVAGKDPRDQCTKGTTACGQDGWCDGAGACRLAPRDTPCGAEACSNGSYTPAARCDGKGDCPTPTPVSCGNYPCQGTSCAMTCSVAAPCASGFYCNSGTCAAKKLVGSTCGVNEECAGGSCAEGICCNEACTATCRSCRAASTGGAEGQCLPVRAGEDPRNHCTATDPTACKEDGLCNGAGQCRMFGSNTVCHTGSCTSGNTISDPTRYCSGSGACQTLPAPETCAPFVCSNASCKKSCQTDVDCMSNYYCAAGGACLLKKNPGDLCGGPAECTSGLCGGRCCPQGQPCQCRQPSSVNLIKDGGFDTNIPGTWWTHDDSPASTVSWEHGLLASDAQSCPYSGSMLFSLPQTQTITKARRCVPIQPTNPGTVYHFGGWVRASLPPDPGDFWVAACWMRFYSSMSTCEANGTPLLDSPQVELQDRITQTETWIEWFSSATAHPSAAAIALHCEAIEDSGNMPKIWLDMLYVSPGPGY